jgi:hypothetical protein
VSPEIPGEELLEALSQNFLMQEGVSGVSVARGSGRRVRVYVESEEYAPLVPQSIAGNPVEVVVVGRFYVLSSPVHKLRYRPIPGGCSVGVPGGPTGTMGLWVYDVQTGARLMLSNAHVFEGGPGTPVIQPGRHDGGVYPDDVVGHVVRLTRVRPPPFLNTVDAAVAAPVDQGLATDEILGLEVVYEPVEPYEGMAVAKSGRTTGVTEGRVVDTNVSVKVFGYPFGYAIFTNQILVMPAVGQPGDSGSCVVEKSTGRVVGLLFSGSERATAVCRIDLVMRELGVTLRPGVAAKPRGVGWAPVLAGLAPVIAVGTVVGVSELGRRVGR